MLSLEVCVNGFTSMTAGASLDFCYTKCSMVYCDDPFSLRKFRVPFLASAEEKLYTFPIMLFWMSVRRHLDRMCKHAKTANLTLAVAASKLAIVG